MSQAVVRVVNVTKRFGDLVAVDGISFDILPGSTTALLGGNGAGKTTTLSMLLGLLLPTSGAISVFGVDMLRDRYRVLGRMNFSSPYVELPRRLTVRQNLEVYARLYGLVDIRRRIEEVGRELEIEGLMHRPYGQLSAGQKTRVALAKALLNEPELLLLDEPTASLDPDTADYVRGMLESYRRRSHATMLLASHNMSEVERLCDNVLMLRAGRLVDRGTPEALLKRYGRQNMEEVFIDIARERRLELALDRKQANP
ncbi:MAG: ABC transporter [Candidatus Muproteobacteria bacterium RBG_16_65_34]|uniref:ABC transporter n=1 Tax=Candidatus Muproteobacteria bacterium RBG_16_65_34 TaxID=1817760 RepID=A0A1F6TPG5_9PROT|nr:MAG: ABC transporter [Candidatus Muproteobacteria bacterium RBG_16_65_34]